MAEFPDGLICIVKRDCPTCALIAPVLGEMTEAGAPLTVYCQDDPTFPECLAGVVDDSRLEASYRLGIEIVPTLIRFDRGREAARAFGWNKDEWRAVSGIATLGDELPENHPGCGARNVESDIADMLAVRFGDSGLASRLIGVPAAADLAEACYDRGWTDGLPVIPPTEVRVLRMLRGTNRDPGDVLGLLAPNYAPCTVEKVAVNAVMAGCKPEYLPVVLAALDAAMDPAFGLHFIVATTAFSSPMIVVNGPLSRAIGMNSRGNVLGQGNRANAAIGRAVQLAIRNIGGGRPGPGGIDRSAFGHPGKYGFCFAEDEEGSCWDSLAVERGFAAGADVVTVIAGDGVQPVHDNASRNPESLARSYASCLRTAYHPKNVDQAGAVLVVGVEHERVFREAGWSKHRLRNEIDARLQIPIAELVEGAGGIAVGYRVAHPNETGDIIELTHAEFVNLGADAEVMRYSTDEFATATLPKFRAGWLDIVRAGGSAGKFSAIITGLRAPDTRPVSREITA